MSPARFDHLVSFLESRRETLTIAEYESVLGELEAAGVAITRRSHDDLRVYAIDGRPLTVFVDADRPLRPRYIDELLGTVDQLGYWRWTS